MQEYINIVGAREHNLKNIDVRIPRHKLTVITGLSGSGKSSLAFDTVFAEGQRRYVESLSSYARQFLGRLDTPDVDKIEGLSPAVAIDQKTTSRNPRSTVGTVTEIYDYMRLLYGRAGTVHCPSCGRPISKQSIDLMLEQIYSYPEGSRMIITAPVVKGKKGRFKHLFNEIRAQGFIRVKVDGRTIEVEELEDDFELELQKKHDISVVVDRVVLRAENKSRIQDSLETALRAGSGYSEIEVDIPEYDREGEITYRKDTLKLSQHFACPDCRVAVQEVSPRLFSFNSPQGACETCGGLGFVWKKRKKGKKHNPFFDFLPSGWQEKAGSEEFPLCPDCHGARLNKVALGVTVGDKNIHELCSLPVNKILGYLNSVGFSQHQMRIVDPVMRELSSRLKFLIDVGLDYLTLSRYAASLSGGESQRIRLATQIGSFLSGVLYVLDEPSIGLHQRDNAKLLKTLKDLRDLGNTVIVVEHDEDTMRNADYIIDMGPGAGRHGGTVVACGTPEEIAADENSLTGDYLAGRKTIDIPKWRKPGDDFLEVIECSQNNLKNINVKIPLGLFVCVTGVSGSGKSSLVNGCILPEIKRHLAPKSKKSGYPRGRCKEIKGLEHIRGMVNIDQSPIGRTPRSNPATYSKAFDHIRDLFAATQAAKMAGFSKSRFSFNVKGGRCESCKGAGFNKIEMNFLPDVYVPCEVCGGSRYNAKTLDIRYKNLNVAEVLDLTVADALKFFENIPALSRILQTLSDVGLDYIKLGQSSTELSGGEAQRVKLAAELAKRSTGGYFYILDEPTTGLHAADVSKLIDILARLVDNGNTVLVIEHNTDLIKSADYLIDLGPEGGEAGGTLVAAGSPLEIALNDASYTGKYLRPVLERGGIKLE